MANEKVRGSTSIFDVASGLSDVILVVEDKELHVNRAVLSQASPVFERMFNGEFKEKESNKITLPGKSYEDVKEMLSVIYPSVMKDVTRKNVDGLLALAEEYQLSALTERCERILVTLCEKSSATEIVHFMLLAGRFDLPTLLERSTDVAAEKPFKDVKTLTTKTAVPDSEGKPFTNLGGSSGMLFRCSTGYPWKAVSSVKVPTKEKSRSI